MEQLLSIKSVPIKVELKINSAKLEYSGGSADLELTRDKGGLTIRSTPIKLNIDTFLARNSMFPTPMESIKQYAQKGINAAYNATANLAREGQLLVNAKLGEDALSQIISQRLDMPKGDFVMDFIPKVGPEITFSEPDLTIEYQMDKLNFDWKISKGNFEFIPGNVELIVTQRPDLIIEYIGDPIYVPPSADPNYEPIDVRA